MIIMKLAIVCLLGMAAVSALAQAPPMTTASGIHGIVNSAMGNGR